MVYKLSPSSLNVMKECGRCFWLQHNKGIRRPAGIVSSLLFGLDKALKLYFDSFRVEGELPRELRDSGIEAKLFSDTKLLEEWRDYRRGLQWKDKHGNVLRGALDDLLERGNKLVVIDYKTRGYPLKSDSAKYYQEQLDIYNFLLRRNGHQTEDYSYLVFYYPKRFSKNRCLSFNTTLVKVETSVESARRIFEEAIKLLERPEIPEAAEKCAYCQYSGQKRQDKKGEYRKRQPAC